MITQIKSNYEIKKFTYKHDQHGNLQEVEIMTDMEHPNIIRMIASFTGLDFGHIDRRDGGSYVSPNKMQHQRKQTASLIS